MKDEIKVGEYIRTKDGFITKILGVDEFTLDEDEIFYETELNEGYTDLGSDDIIKHSSNIIDLIEEGDLIKYRLKNFEQTNIGMVEKRVDPRSLKEVITVGFYRINQVEILKIITKEELEKGGYEVANV